jgi:hypothetical protein
MVTQELIDGIKKALDGGQTTEEIKQEMVDNGWENTEIEEGFQKAGLGDSMKTSGDWGRPWNRKHTISIIATITLGIVFYAIPPVYALAHPPLILLGGIIWVSTSLYLYFFYLEDWKVRSIFVNSFVVFVFLLMLPHSFLTYKAAEIVGQLKQYDEYHRIAVGYGQEGYQLQAIEYFEKMLDVAPRPAYKAQAQLKLAIAYAIINDEPNKSLHCGEVAKLLKTESDLMQKLPKEFQVAYESICKQ